MTKSRNRNFADAAVLDLPDPDDGESHDEFVDRCTRTVMDDSGCSEGDAVDACEMRWEERGANGIVYKTHANEIPGTEFTLSDDTPDRMGDIIASEGWDLANFQKNPIALFQHRPDWPIGKWRDLRIGEGRLRGHLDLAPKGISQRIDEIRALIDCGILNAVSVGFRPIEDEPRNAKDPWGGVHFKQQELLECSVVTVPANANALAVAKSLNISPATLDLVFAKHGTRDDARRRRTTGKHAETSRNRKGSTMSRAQQLAQRIIDLQAQITQKAEELEAHLDKQDDSNVSDVDMEKTQLLNSQLKQLRRQHEALVDSEKQLGTTVDGGGTTATSRALATGADVQRDMRQAKKKGIEPIDYLLRAGVCTIAAKIMNVPADVARVRIYGEDEQTKAIHEWATKAATAPAMTTVTGWAAELVQQVYSALIDLLMARSILPRLSAKGLSLTFGTAGKIVLPSRSRTPTIAGSFVGEGMAIPVRQGAFTSVTHTPKKVAVITVWTREMEDHSIPAIEGVLRQAIQEDTAVAVDSILLDANPATIIRPAGLLNGVAALTPTAGGGLAALIGDIKQLVAALTTSTLGNVRAPVWLMNPTDMLSASLVSAANTGIFPFREEISRGVLATIPIIDSATVPAKTIVLVDAADFVSMGGENVRFDASDQATLHMEDTTPLDLVSGSPGVVASPQRSLFQTDSLALRMVMPLNWANRRAGTVGWIQNVTW